MGIMARLLDRYVDEKDSKNSEKLSQEIDNIEIEYSDAQNRAQRAFDEVHKVATCDKFVRKLESASYKSQTPDMVKGKDNVSWSSFPVQRSLHQPLYEQKSATEKSYLQLQDASESHLCDVESQPAVFDQSSSGMHHPETRLFASDNRQRVIQ